MRLVRLALAASFLATGPVQGAVITDGTMAPSGSSTVLQGPNYALPGELGRREGNNLFHSFSRFDLSRTESATFTGPSAIENIISRVTGGRPSSIDGRISSTIPGAHLYLVNPSGIMFGPNATLDLSGSFYATTADYLQIGPVRFDATATVPGNFELAIVPPSAFGFLDANPAPIVVGDALLSVPAGTLTFVGGDIDIKRNGRGEGAILSSPGGINLVSVGSAGEAVVSDGGIDTATFGSMGRATISNSVAARKESAQDLLTGTGRIFIAAGSFIVNGARITSNATATSQGGDLSVSAAEVEVTSGGTIQTRSSAEGRAGDVSIAATRSITLSGNKTSQSGIITGNAGSVALQAPRVTLENMGVVELNRNGSGQGGDLRITSGELKVLGPDSFIINKRGAVAIDTGLLTMSQGSITAVASGAGAGSRGDIVVKAKEITLSQGSRIATDGTGAGSITIDAADGAVTLDHSYIYIGNWAGASHAVNSISGKDITIKNGGSIVSISSETKTGDINVTASGRLTLSGNGLIRSNSLGSEDAGNIKVSASSVVLETGGTIETWVGDPEVANPPDPVTGNGGSIFIDAAESVTISGPGSKMDVSTNGKGDAGALTITSPLLRLDDQGKISSESRITDRDAGSAGSIVLNIANVLSLDSASITTDAARANGGNITIDPRLVYLRNGNITTSVHGGDGDGGNISLASDAVVLEGSSVAADADEGHGGRVGITAALYLAHRESTVTASSERGIPGTVDISAPLVDLSGNLVMLPERMLEGDDLAPRTCAVSDDSSSFIVKAAPLRNRPDRNLLAL